MNSDGAEIQSARTIEFLAWVEVNKRRLVVVGVVLGLVAAGAAVFRWHRNEREMAASSALLKVQSSAASNPLGSPPPAEFQKVAAEFPATAAAARAHLLAGEAFFRGGQYAEALAEFEMAARSRSDDSLQALAAYSRAASLDALGRVAEAQAAYGETATRYAGAAVAGQARLALAGLLESTGDYRQALQTYNQLTNTAMSAWASEAQSRRAALLASHPELVTTNLPPAASLSGS